VKLEQYNVGALAPQEIMIPAFPSVSEDSVITTNPLFSSNKFIKGTYSANFFCNCNNCGLVLLFTYLLLTYNQLALQDENHDDPHARE
jgi:hypothetical protein